MFSFILRRIVSAIPTMLGVALLVFILFNVVGGDPALQLAGRHATAERLAQIRLEYGLDQPLFTQFLRYLKEIVTFDFGRSYATKQPISTMILQGIGPTLSVAVPAFVITSIVSLIASLLIIAKRGQWPDRLTLILCVMGMSIPALGYILFGQYLVAYKLGWFPVSGFESDWSERIKYIVLPALIWISLSIGYDVRFYRTALLEEISQDYVRTARAKGLSDVWVLSKHVLKVSMIPILTHLVLEIPMLILGSFLIENFFSIPGLGSMTIDAVHNSDLPVLKAMATVTSFLYILGNLLTDILYAVFDPRVRIS